MGDILSSVNSTLYKFNQILHDSADAATKTPAYIKSSASSIMTSKRIKNCFLWDQCNDYVYFTVFTISLIADVNNHICGNVLVVKRFIAINTYM